MMLIFWTAANKEEAERIIQQLLEENLIACGSIFPEVLSFYVWKGAVEKSREVKVFLKTKNECVSLVSERIQKKSSYDVPEITAFSPSYVSPSYKKWLEEVL